MRDVRMRRKPRGVVGFRTTSIAIRRDKRLVVNRALLPHSPMMAVATGLLDVVIRFSRRALVNTGAF